VPAPRVRALRVLHQLRADLALELLHERVAREHIREGKAHGDPTSARRSRAKKSAEGWKERRKPNNATFSRNREAARAKTRKPRFFEFAKNRPAIKAESRRLPIAYLLPQQTQLQRCVLSGRRSAPAA
jgi:hypothetical protein